METRGRHEIWTTARTLQEVYPGTTLPLTSHDLRLPSSEEARRVTAATLPRPRRCTFFNARWVERILRIRNPVTAKIALMDRTGESREGTVTGRWGKKGDDPAEKGNVCWVSATPLLDADDNVGVWMVVIVDEKSVPSNRSRVPDALSGRKENGRPHGVAQGGGEASGKVPDRSEENSERAPTPGLEETTLGTPSQLPESSRSQRSDSVDEQDQAIANGVPIESTNGSPVSSPSRSSTHLQAVEEGNLPNGYQEECITPPGTEIEVASDTTPTQLHHGGEAQYARDVGLRAMDYLSSRSLMQQLQARDRTENGKGENVDLSAASPYSVD